MEKTLIIISIVIISTLVAQEFEAPYLLEIKDVLPQGNIKIQGDVCRFSWRMLDFRKNEVNYEFLQKNFLHYKLKIVRILEGKKGHTADTQIALGQPRYSWQIPEIWKNTKYLLTIEAIPAKEKMRSVSGSFEIYVRSPFSALKPPEKYQECLRILMDWNGRRGYCLETTPEKAWKYAVSACRWIRANVEPGLYQDYLNTIEKIENTRLEQLKIYCGTEHAELKIDNMLVGFFKEWSRDKQMYVLQVTLPTGAGYGYKLETRKGDEEYQGFHTHIAAGDYIIDHLYKTVKISINTEMTSRVGLEGRKLSKSGNIHILVVHARKIQVIEVIVQDGPTLKIIVNPRKSSSMRIIKRGNLYFLVKNKKSYDFVGNKISLIKFQ